MLCCTFFFFFVVLLCFYFFFFFFFFSSRRRHTRLVSDWSSDVCSSDLQAELRRTQAQRELSLAQRRLVAEIQSRSEEHTSELQSLTNLVCRLLLEKKKDPLDNALHH